MTTAPLALTMGEPAGIGGEITIAAWRMLRDAGPQFVLIDDPDRVAALARHVGGVPLAIVDEVEDAPDVFSVALPVLPLGHRVPLALGSPDPATAPAVLASIERAVDLALSDRVTAVVTNPIHKAVLIEGGFAHPGHTEYLAALANVPRTVMMVATDALRVVPITIHVPLKDVPDALTESAIVDTARIVARALRTDFAIDTPRIAVAGLNPHAGEQGRMGAEEAAVITPAIETLRAEGLDVVGPLSADTMFHEAARRRYDAALTMYHDQALIPIKTIAFDEGVNVTLGLPFVRTSPDHGTALDIAGKGVARAQSLIAALTMAATIAARRSSRRTLA